jgi:hypothetical protein
MYCDVRTLNLEGDKRFVESEFECSRFCLDNVVEEDEFFRTHLGELAHPAQLQPYVYCVLRHLPVDTPITGCSRKDYLAYLEKYTTFYHSAIAERRFHPRDGGESHRSCGSEASPSSCSQVVRVANVRNRLLSLSQLAHPIGRAVFGVCSAGQCDCNRCSFALAQQGNAIAIVAVSH